MATSSVASPVAVAVTADTAGPTAEGSSALHIAEGSRALLPLATAPDASARLRAACGAHPVLVAVIGCLAAPAAYAIGKGASRCRRRARGREPLRVGGAAEPALAIDEELSPVYRGRFTHPAFEGEVPVVVKLEAAYRGWWRALGQTEKIDVCRSGSAVSFREVKGATILEGNIQSGSGAIVGTVVQDGVRGGAFELTPEQDSSAWSTPRSARAPPEDQELAAVRQRLRAIRENNEAKLRSSAALAEGCGSAVAPDASSVMQVPKHAGLADAPPTPPSDFSDDDVVCQEILSDEHGPFAQSHAVASDGSGKARRVPEFCTCAACKEKLALTGAQAAPGFHEAPRGHAERSPLLVDQADAGDAPHPVAERWAEALTPASAGSSPKAVRRGTLRAAAPRCGCSIM